jgi:putative hydrolase of HD superfamily
MNTEKQSENTFSEQTKRLEQQISFIREMDKEKFIGRQTYYQMERGKRMMRNMHGIWH